MFRTLNKLNLEFSDRIEDISGNTESSKDKSKVVEIEKEVLNMNNKRIVKDQGSRLIVQ
jgi:hypothetical protein